MRHRGKITEWRDIRGFGFITPEGGGDRVFVHLNAFQPNQQRPQGRERVSFDLAKDARGRICARKVEFLDPRLRHLQYTGGDRGAVGVAALFLAGLAGLIIVGRLPWAVLALYLVLSVVTFYVYSADKAAAEQKRWRTSEGTLLFWGLLGGWPGALVAQRLRRHKSRKQPFQVFFWVSVLVNCGALLGLGTSVGRTAILDLLRRLP